MSAIDQIIDFAVAFKAEDMDQTLRYQVKLALMDTMGSMYAGVNAEGVGELTALASLWGGNPQATVVTDGSKNSVRMAALVNGVAARGWDLDDVHEQLTCHVNASIVPAVLAAAEYAGCEDGEEIMTAIAIGAEVTCRIAAAPSLSFSVTGSPPSYHCTVFGSAVAAGLILGLDRDKIHHALGIAYACMAGNHQGYVDGAVTVRLLQGVSAETGVAAAMMAAQGMRAAGDVLEGRFGFYPVYQRNAYVPARLTDKLGEHWEQKNISIKPLYPCCKFTHGPIEATIKAMRELGIAADDIEKLNVTVSNKEVFDLVCTTRERKWHPQSVVEVQFSLPFTMAFAAIHGRVGFELLTPETRRNKDVLALTQRVDAELKVEEQGSSRGTFPMPGTVTLTATGGRKIDMPFQFVKGHPTTPMSFDEVADKARACAAHGLPGWAGIEDAIEAIRAIGDKPFYLHEILPAWPQSNAAE